MSSHNALRFSLVLQWDPVEREKQASKLNTPQWEQIKALFGKCLRIMNSHCNDDGGVVIGDLFFSLSVFQNAPL